METRNWISLRKIDWDLVAGVLESNLDSLEPELKRRVKNVLEWVENDNVQ